MKIEFLKLYTSNLKAQHHFYGEVLELPVDGISKGKFRVEIGFSTLEFEEDLNAEPYHVAFHIPALQEEKALKWLRKKVEILQDDGNEIIDFPAWQAKSIYFYDKDRNILEFISRSHMYHPSSEEFSAASIVGISEVGLATSNVEEKFNFLNDNFGLTKFTGDYEHFCATGDDEGLFIIINKEQKDWIPVGDKAYASPFEINISVQNAIFGASYKHERLTLL
ncbi:VOC family protein [Salinimicrobium sediminilitoris]|uniref:VOC family protein n=1 Tax=Salinimicrobium sediminilitoris TaxID=2876715 RepID=UPI001E3A1917|nr:VOC family protein [Salinimicrobium sediminilitoris]MCC8361269.1 VOC family protein [Salinimicrobium sediminilitoris]